MNKEVIRFIKRYGLTKNNLSSSLLERIFTEIGYRIILFNKSHNPQAVQKVIDAYGLNNQIKNRKVFTFTDDEVKMLFVHEHINEDALIHYLLHELGHIWLRHTRNSDDEDIQEKEADEFAVLVKVALQNRYRLQKAGKRCVFIMSATMLIVCLVCLLHIPERLQQTSNTVTAISSPAPFVSSEVDVVYVTKSGSKFHKRNCRHIKNSSTVLEIPYNDAVISGYEPCRDCFSELY